MDFFRDSAKKPAPRRRQAVSTDARTEMREVRTDNNRVLGTTEINRWIYQTGSTVRILVFLDQKLQSIERLY